MKAGRLFIWMVLSVFVFIACENEITLDLPEPEDLIVVDASIYEDSVAVVVLSRNFSFFGTSALGPEADIYVGGATVTLSSEGESIELTELNVPIVIDSTGTTITATFYADINGEMIGEVGKTYSLTVEAEEKVITASTSIPEILPVDSIWWIPNVINDTLWGRVYSTISDPDTLGNYYRYFTRRNDEPLYAGLGSVFDDKVINGTSLDLPIDRGYDRQAALDFSTYGLFEPGDTVLLRLCGIDEDTFNFWLTLENNSNSGGPFASPTVVDSNIEGGLGIFAGYSVDDTYIILTE